tara:strand:+ start:201 stop:668 length:468 start_codon:yes stop_codon:yes gene_type:complete
MYNIQISRKEVDKQLRKLQPISYNRFRWWRWYQPKTKPLPNKSRFIDKIKNGDFDYSCYKWQSYLCEYQLNDLLEECGTDYQKYLENSTMLRTRRKKLIEDFEKDENERLRLLYSGFKKQFKINKDKLEEYISEHSGDIIELYYIIEDEYRNNKF